MAEFHPSDKELEEDDPYEFVAVRFPLPEGTDGDEVMARCFIEEYALMGMPPAKMMTLFRSKLFNGTHSIYESRGEQFVQALIDDIYGPRQREA